MSFVPSTCSVFKFCSNFSASLIFFCNASNAPTISFSTPLFMFFPIVFPCSFPLSLFNNDPAVSSFNKSVNNVFLFCISSFKLVVCSFIFSLKILVFSFSYSLFFKINLDKDISIFSNPPNSTSGFMANFVSKSAICSTNFFTCSRLVNKSICLAINLFPSSVFKFSNVSCPKYSGYCALICFKASFFCALVVFSSRSIANKPVKDCVSFATFPATSFDNSLINFCLLDNMDNDSAHSPNFCINKTTPAIIKPIPIPANATLSTFNAPVLVPIATLHNFCSLVTIGYNRLSSFKASVKNCCVPVVIAITAFNLTKVFCRSSFSIPNNACTPITA